VAAKKPPRKEFDPKSVKQGIATPAGWAHAVAAVTGGAALGHAYYQGVKSEIKKRAAKNSPARSGVGARKRK
jgi:hypothetical protein